MKIDLEHNPFLIKTHLVIDGENLPINDPLLEKLQQRLQNWVGDFFYDLREKLGEIAFTVSFKGLSTDLEDLLSAAKEAESDPEAAGFDIQINYQPTDSVAKRMEDLKKLIKELSEFDGLSSKKDFIAECKQALDPKFDINVIATMSSGKSTIINSMIGQELLPAKNEATTATLVRIANTPGQKSFIAQRLGENEQELDAWQEINEVKVAEWNANSETTLINIQCEIQGVTEEGHTSLVLVDTPGPNNSQNVSHGITTLRMIKDQKMSLVLYVIDATKIGVDDDKNLLNTVRETIVKNGLATQDRFVFLINRIDELDHEKGESPLKTVENVKAYLNKNGIKSPLVIPISAKTTLIKRKKEKGLDLTRKEKGELNNFVPLFVDEKEMQVIKHLSISSSVKSKMVEMLEEARKANDKELEASIHAGIPIVELVIQEYLNKHALPTKIGDTYKVIKRHLDAAVNKEELMSHLEASEEELKKTYDAIIHLSEEMDKIKKDNGNRINFEDIKESTKKDFFCCVEKIMKSSSKKIKEISSKHFQEAKYNKKIDIKEAAVFFSELEKSVNFWRNEVVVSLELESNKIIEEKNNEIIKSYSKAIESVFSNAVNDERFDIIKRLKSASLSIADKASFFKTIRDKNFSKCYRVEEITVGYETIEKIIWYKPWTWLEDDEKIEKKKVMHFIDLDSFHEILNREASLELKKLMALEEAKILEKIKENVDHFNEIIKKNIDDEINSISNDVNSKIRSKESILVFQKEHQEKLRLLQEIENRITCIAS